MTFGYLNNIPNQRNWMMPLCSAALLALCAMMTAPLQAQTAQATTPNQSPEPAWIVQRLQRPVPMHTPFVEVRTSPLLRTPLRISGQYRRPDADTFVREITAPYQERTTITIGQNGQPGYAQIQRANRSRTVSLARAPQLASLQTSFAAMLSGDLAQIQRHYTLRSSGTSNAWQLHLQPKDAALAGQIRQIVLYGQGAELRCIQTHPAQGEEIQRTLLASAAQHAQTITDTDALNRLCEGSR